MRALTVRQPWASLIALGVKTVETRSWSTAYRGPVLIHAGARSARLNEAWDAWRATGISADGIEATRYPLRDRGADALPLGAVVAVANLTDCLPIVDSTGCSDDHPHLCVYHGTGSTEGRAHSALDRPFHDGETEHIVSNQIQFGDFAPGRYAWLLSDVRPLPLPIPATGRQGLWKPDAELVAACDPEWERVP